ncbi:MAG: response regulator [Candidatus Dormibacteria bacterium]|nr:response regulator transcription factor [Candidatus Saccharimonadales bacterium]
MDVTNPTPIRVLIVDDHPLVRRGLTSLLNGTTDIKVVGAASDGEEAVAYAVEEHPDIVLMDISMPGMNGFEALRRMLKAVAGTKVVMLTSYSEHDMVVEAIDNGAVGFLLKDTEPQELLNGIRSAAKGDTPLSPKAAKELLRDRVKRRPLDDLTQRELDVLTLVGRGMSNKQIAWRLGISEKTVKAHLGSVFDRLGVEDRVQAALWAQRHGII